MAIFSKIPMYGKVKAGQIIFTTSQTWTVPKGVKKADVFLVGGAGGGGTGYFSLYTDGAVHAESAFGGGGGGGYTSTHLDVEVTPNSLVNIIVGKGGLVSNNGNPSSFGALSVGGGKAGSNSSPGSVATGGAGGSGGGGGGSYKTVSGTESGTVVVNDVKNGLGGTNGANGGNSYNQLGGTYFPNGGLGQGTTTRAFGEANGIPYSSGGTGGAIEVLDGSYVKRYGAGGNGSTTSAGNDGIVIVRWDEQ